MASSKIEQSKVPYFRGYAHEDIMATITNGETTWTTNATAWYRIQGIIPPSGGGVSIRVGGRAVLYSEQPTRMEIIIPILAGTVVSLYATNDCIAGIQKFYD